MYLLALDDDGILRVIDKAALFDLFLECFDYLAENAILVDDDGDVIG